MFYTRFSFKSQLQEAFDYIGSGRMVYEMERNNFPEPHGTYLETINLNHISSIVEVNQVAHRDENKLWIHRDPVGGRNETISAEVSMMCMFFISRL